MQKAEDTLRTANVDLQSAIDTRLEALLEATETLGALKDGLEKLRESIDRRPALLTAQLEQELAGPTGKIREAETALGTLLKRTEEALESARKREILAAFLVGSMLGLFGGLILSLA